MATMQYGDYIARVMLDEARGVFHGRIENLADVVSFEGATVEELQQSRQTAKGKASTNGWNERWSTRLADSISQGRALSGRPRRIEEQRDEVDLLR